LTVLEDKLRLEKQKVATQGKIIWNTRRQLRKLTFDLEQRMKGMHPDSVGYKKTKELKERIEEILNEMEKEYFDFKRKLQAEKPAAKIEHFGD